MWRNRLARSAVNRQVGGSSPPRDVNLLLNRHININTSEIAILYLNNNQCLRFNDKR